MTGVFILWRIVYVVIGTHGRNGLDIWKAKVDKIPTQLSSNLTQFQPTLT
jgi:hypothetical protein